MLEQIDLLDKNLCLGFEIGFVIEIVTSTLK
jgi:hypothetical protein